MINNQDSKVAKLLTMTILDGVVTLSSVSQILGKDLHSIAKRESQEHQLFWNKKSAKLEQVLKNITVSDVEKHADCLTDLVKLENKNSNFTIFDAQKEVSYQVGNFSGSTCILADEKGNPIRDMPNTRGMTINWFQYCYFVWAEC